MFLVMFLSPPLTLSFFFFNDTATTEIYPLSLHDALPIFENASCFSPTPADPAKGAVALMQWISGAPRRPSPEDRKSTRLNSSHDQISYAVFCLKKKKTQTTTDPYTMTKTSYYRIVCRVQE